MEWEFDREMALDENRAFSVIAHIGPNDSPISEGFTVTVCNVDYVRRIIKQCGYFSGLWFLILDNGKLESIEQYFSTAISKLSGETWDDFFQKLIEACIIT